MGFEGGVFCARHHLFISYFISENSFVLTPDVSHIWILNEWSLSVSIVWARITVTNCFLSIQVFTQQQNHTASPWNLLQSSGHEEIVSEENLCENEKRSMSVTAMKADSTLLIKK